MKVFGAAKTGIANICRKALLPVLRTEVLFLAFDHSSIAWNQLLIFQKPGYSYRSENALFLFELVINRGK